MEYVKESVDRILGVSGLEGKDILFSKQKTRFSLDRPSHKKNPIEGLDVNRQMDEESIFVRQYWIILTDSNVSKDKKKWDRSCIMT